MLCAVVLCCRVVLCCCVLLSCCGAVGACSTLLWRVSVLPREGQGRGGPLGDKELDLLDPANQILTSADYAVQKVLDRGQDKGEASPFLFPDGRSERTAHWLWRIRTTLITHS